jgi:plastocyanin
MKLKWVPVLAVALGMGGWAVTTTLEAQARSNDANITMMDNCSNSDPAYNGFGGCPEGAPFPGSSSYSGDVSVAEFFQFLFSPLAPGAQVIGHPSWRNEPSYISIPAGRRVRVTNGGGRAHTFTEVANFGGGFIPPLNGALFPAPECANPNALTFVRYGGSQTLNGLDPGLHQFQCCIHPWMRAAIRVNAK